MNSPHESNVIIASQIGDPDPFFSKIREYSLITQLRAAVELGVEMGIKDWDQWAQFFNDQFDFILDLEDYLDADRAKRLFKTCPVVFKAWANANDPKLHAKVIHQIAIDLVEQAQNMTTIKVYNQMYNRDAAPDSDGLSISSEDDSINFTITAGG